MREDNAFLKLQQRLAQCSIEDFEDYDELRIAVGNARDVLVRLEAQQGMVEPGRRGFREGCAPIGYRRPKKATAFRPSQVAALFQINHSTIRARLKRGWIPTAYKDEHGEWCIPLNGLIGALNEEPWS